MLCVHLHIYCLQLMHKQESFKCETDRKRTHFLWRRPVKFGSSHNKIFILSSSRAFYSGEINRWSPENLLACGGFFCQVVKRECGWFYSRHDHLHPGGGSVFQSSVMLSGAHPSCFPLNPTSSQHRRSPSLHLVYSDMIFTYLWILFDRYYQPVRRRKALEKRSLFHLKGWTM